MLSLALCLSTKHSVTLFWNKEDEILAKAKERFAFDLSPLTFAPSIFGSSTSFFQRYRESKRYDLIIVLSDGSIPLIGCPLILHFQSPMLWVNGRTLKNRYKLSRVKDVIVNSQFTKEYTDKSLGRQSIVLYPPVTIQREYLPSKKQKVILNVGRFGINQAGSSYKKQDILADTFVEMIKEGQINWKLVLVMSVHEKDNSAFEAFKEKYKDYPIEIVSNVTNQQLWDMYEMASIYWHASGFGEDLVLHPDRAEHFGISTVEAMGVGAVPIVVSAGGQKEIVSDGVNGRLWSTTDELQHATRELIKRSDLLQRFAQQSVNDARKYSEERFCSEVMKLVI